MASPAYLRAEQVAEALAGFVGRISQEPPAFSAVKVEGRRAYDRARAGQAGRPAARQVEVYSAALLEFEPGERASALIRVVCGSGVYLRSLARDLGDRLGVGGYLGRLARTAYGPLRLEDAFLPQDLPDLSAVDASILPPEVLLPGMERVRLTVDQEAQVRRGQAVRVMPEPQPGLLRAHDEGGLLVALGHTDPLRRTFVPDKVLG